MMQVTSHPHQQLKASSSASSELISAPITVNNANSAVVTLVINAKLSLLIFHQLLLAPAKLKLILAVRQTLHRD